MKQKIMTFIMILMFLAGIGLLLYPIISNLYYEKKQNEFIDYYSNMVTEDTSKKELEKELKECIKYNDSLRKGGVILTDPFDETQLDPTAMPYAGLLNLNGDGSMGFIEIPVIDVRLMIYHGTEEEVLFNGVGHLQGSSLPVGGKGTHSVLSAHTGLESRKLFTDLDKLIVGDVFYITTLGEKLAYQVDQIKVTIPTDTSDLMINSERDYVTLITCTPYGVNSHRLLVRGHRIPYEEAKNIEDSSDSRGSTWMQNYIMAFAVGIGIVLAFIIIKRIYDKLKK